MKWWQLTWLLGENLTYLRQVLDRPEWLSYEQWLDDHESHVRNQRRDILDAVVSDDVCLKALAACPWLYRIEDGYLRGGYRSKEGERNPQLITAVDAYRRYGADAVVDAVEKGTVFISTANQDGSRT